MQYTKLGHSDMQVSVIGFGCMSLGAVEEPAIRLVQEAIASGINFFDTADLYDKGVNEQIVGKALRGKRNQVYVATKVGNQWREDGSGWDWNPRKAYIMQAVEQSLNRLQTDYIDLYQLHGGTIEDPIDETIETFELLRQQGKIRYYGISSIRPNVIREYIRQSNIASVMMQYSLLDRRPEEYAMPALSEKGIGLLARGTLAQGLLAGKPARPYLGHTAEQVEDASKLVDQLSIPNRKPAQTALRFVLQQPQISAAITGIRNREQLKDILDTLATPPLSPEEIELLRENIPALPYSDHR